MSASIVPASDGEFPTPEASTEVVTDQLVDDAGHPVADVEFPMPGVETVYYDDNARKAAEAEAKTVDKADTKVVDKGSASTKAE